MTVQDAARLLGVSLNTVRRWVDAGILRGWRIHPDRANSQRRVDPDDAERKRRELAGEAPPPPRRRRT